MFIDSSGDFTRRPPRAAGVGWRQHHRRPWGRLHGTSSPEERRLSCGHSRRLCHGHGQLTCGFPEHSLFHMAWKQGLSERSTLDELLEELGNRLPDGWQVDIGEEPRGPTDLGVDAILTIAEPGGQQARVVVDVRSALEPASAANSALQLLAARRSNDADGSLLVAPFLSPRTEGSRSRGRCSPVVPRCGP